MREKIAGEEVRVAIDKSGRKWESGGTMNGQKSGEEKERSALRHPVRYRLEYAAVRVVGGLAAVLPYRAALALAAGVARLAYWGMGGRRREVYRRIREVFGDEMPARRVRKIAWQSLRNIAFNAAEMVYMNGGREKRSLAEHIENLAEVLTQFKGWADQNPGKGLIFASPHMGNWELAGLIAPMVGKPIFTLYAPQHNPYVTDYISRLRAGADIELLPRGEATSLKRILANLRAGKTLGILPDLRSKTPGVEVSFLGGKANLYPGMALLARQTGVPIFLAMMRREGWTKHHLTLEGPFYADASLSKDEDVQRLTEVVMQRVEVAIRETPEQWFWFNKRWVLEPREK